MSQSFEMRLRDDVEFRERYYKKGMFRDHLEMNGELIFFRSHLEKRVALLFNSLDVEWKHEPKRFQLTTLNKSYTPDFYLPELGLWVEVKGWWRDIAKQKWNAFCAEYPTLSKGVLYVNQVKAWEDDNNEGRFKESCGLSDCLRYLSEG